MTTILVVEDELKIARLVRDYLVDAGFDVLTRLHLDVKVELFAELVLGAAARDERRCATQQRAQRHVTPAATLDRSPPKIGPTAPTRRGAAGARRRSAHRTSRAGPTRRRPTPK